MFGGARKVGRGGGGGVMRNFNSNSNAPPISRSNVAPGGHIPLGGASATWPRGRGGATATSTGSHHTVAPVKADETYSLVTGNPLNFAMIIRLTPDLVDEIKRVEAEGGSARIKFDANANITNGNAIYVGDKNFKFTWARETGDLCDIYEERQSGEDGNGLLVESGGAWRKLNVQRVLDESTKNHVKMRSEEAERKLKSRKAIVLDHQNPTMKNQIKALAAAESNPWRMPFKQKKEPPFKKRKAEPSSGGPPKSVHKSGLATTIPFKGRTTDSPLSSPLEQSGAPASSPLGSGNIVKGHPGIQDVKPTQATNKTASSEKEMPSRVMSSTERDKPHKGNMALKAADLRSLVISLLMEHQSKGMSLKGLEKAIGDAKPNSVRQIEPILKQIATFQAPGRYFLKPGGEMENFKKPSESGSSPELNHYPSPAPEKHVEMPALEASSSMRTETNELKERAELTSMPGHALKTTENINILHNSPNALSAKKVSENNEVPAASSSDSGSDSDSESDSSDSGSDYGSHSRSRNPVASRSGSSSDSESDVSSNGKQASDEDVDIMTSDDDKKSKHRLQDSEPVSPKSAVLWRPPDSEPADIGIDDRVSDVFEIEKDFSRDNREVEMAEATYSVFSKDGEKHIGGTKLSSRNNHEPKDNRVFEQKFDGEPENVSSDDFNQQQSDSAKRMPGNFKRRSDDEHFEERPYNSKRLKNSNSSQTMSGTMNAFFGESPDRPLHGHHKGPYIQMDNRTAWNGTNDSGAQKGVNLGIPSTSISESQQPGQRTFDASGQAKAPSVEEGPGKQANLGCGVKYSERNLQTNEGLHLQKDKSKREAQGEDGFTSERRPDNFSLEGVGDKHAVLSESHHGKHENTGKVKEAGYMGHSSKDKDANFTDRSPVMNGRGSVLRREHSELELGEFCEPLPNETHGSKKQFERRSSFKKSETKATSSEYWNLDPCRGKPSNEITLDSRKVSPSNPNIMHSVIPDGLSKRKTPEHYADDLLRTHHRTVQSQPQQYQSSTDHSEVGSQGNKSVDPSKRNRHNEGGTSLGITLEAHGDAYGKVPVNAPEEQHDPKRVIPSTKEIKKQKSETIVTRNDKRKDASLKESNDDSQKRRESFSDENSSLYSRYEKDKPELNVPVKDLSQYKEYVQEYQEKYESYCSLNKILESYRNEFDNLGKDLQVYRGRDAKRYHDTLGQMKSSFRECGERHKRLKKIFIVLHEELKHLKQMIKDYAASHTKDRYQYVVLS